MAWQLRTITVQAKGPSLVSRTHVQQLKTIYNFSSRGYETLCWTPWASLLKDAQTTTNNNTYVHIIKKLEN